MRKIVVLTLAVGLVAMGWPAGVVAAPAAGAGKAQAQQPGTISGTAQDADKTPLANHTVRLRNVDTGQLAGQTTSNAAGEFAFTGLSPANYAIEVVDAAGNIIATSATIPLTAGAVVSGVAVTATAAGAAAAAAAAGGLGAFFASTAGIVLLAAVGVGITAAAIAAGPPASPSR